MRKVLIIALAVLFALGGGIWWLVQDPAGSQAYSVLAETDEGGTRKCGLTYLDALATDAAGHELYLKVTVSTELLEGKQPVAVFGVEGIRVMNPETKSGENLRISEASLVAGELDTRTLMRRPSGDIDAFFAISTEVSGATTLPLDMLDGSRLTVQLAGESEPRSFALPGVGSRDGGDLIACFRGMQARVQALAAEKSGSGSDAEAPGGDR